MNKTRFLMAIVSLALPTSVNPARAADCYETSVQQVNAIMNAKAAMNTARLHRDKFGVCQSAKTVIEQYNAMIALLENPACSFTSESERRSQLAALKSELATLEPAYSNICTKDGQPKS